MREKHLLELYAKAAERVVASTELVFLQHDVALAYGIRRAHLEAAQAVSIERKQTLKIGHGAALPGRRGAIRWMKAVAL